MRQRVAHRRRLTGAHCQNGLGIEAPRATIARFAAAEGRDVLAEGAGLETGKGADALNAGSMRTARRVQWHTRALQNLLARADWARAQ